MNVARNHSLTNHGVPYLRRHVLACTEVFELFVVMAHDVVGCASLHEVDDIVLAERLLHGDDSLQHYQQRLLAVALHLRMQTVVAVAAILVRIFLAEVVQQHLASAHRCLGVCGSLLQQLLAYVLLSHGLALHELLQLLQVFVGVECYAYTLAAVASCATRFLIIALKTLRYVVVYDEAHVGFVDAHAEGYGSHDDVDALHEEVVLRLRACSRVEAGVISRRLYVVGFQHGSQFLHLLARDAVDDAALARVLFDEFNDLLVDVVRLLSHLIIKVSAVERALEFLRVGYAQTLLYVHAHLVGGCSRERYDRSCANLVYRRAYVAVFGAEVVTPLRYAVRLVDGVERNLERTEELQVVLFVERLRRHIKQFCAALVHILVHLIDGSAVERRVQIVSHAGFLAESVHYIHLVLHQRDERRHHDCRAFHDERRQLVAQALASACRHEHECVIAFKQIAYYCFLVALERVEPEVVF